MTAPEIPTPEVESWGEEFWRAAKEEEVLLMQRCTDCGELEFYPKKYCASCGAESLEWIESSGTGEIYTFTVVRKALHPSFEGDLPYTIAVVELDEGVRLLTNVTGNPADVACGKRVEVEFDHISEEFAIPKFHLV